MTPELIAAVVGVLLTLIFYYVPGAQAWLDTKTAEQKRLVMLGATLLVALGALGIACTGFAADFGLPLTCDRAGIVGLIKAFLAAIGANQASYMALKNYAPK